MQGFIICLLCLLPLHFLQAQEASDGPIIRGTVVDAQSEQPLIGATVQLLNEAHPIGSSTDIDGAFTLVNVPLGRQQLIVRYLGYEDLVVPNVLVTSGKQVVLRLRLEEKLTDMKQIEVTAKNSKDRPLNEMATVSSRSISVDEIRRYAGGRGDIAHLVKSYAGVGNSEDARNDIVIRGNSPTGVLWRLEGAPIPNPNHFSSLGATGGPVGMINTNLLANSDFLTGAFPAEYGNATAGVMDLRFRRGNEEELEFTGQIGFNGLEAMAEGPLNKRGGSFVASYRYTVTGVIQALGGNIGTTATPIYQDLSFNFDFGKSKLGRFSIFGLGGLSNIQFLDSETESDDFYAGRGQNLYNGSDLGITGLRHQLFLNDNAYLKTVLTASYARAYTNIDRVGLNSDSALVETPFVRINDQNYTYSLSSMFNQKISAAHTFRAGLVASLYQLQLGQEVNHLAEQSNLAPDWIATRDTKNALGLLEFYAQSKYRFSAKWTLNTGIHLQYLPSNQSFAPEPRLALSWAAREGQRWALAYGMHHQMQPLPTYFNQVRVGELQYQALNTDLGFNRSQHLVLAYDWSFAPDWRLKTELYGQYLDQIAVEKASTSYSVLNQGSGFFFPRTGELENEGQGYNYGLELTLEKFFSKGYYGLLTASLFDSKYLASDAQWRNTAFNSNYIINFLAGKEFRLGKKEGTAFTVDTKLTYAGGRYNTPFLRDADGRVRLDEDGDPLLDWENAFSERLRNYFRMDFKVGYQLNQGKITQTFFIDFQNIFNTRNIFRLQYNENAPNQVEEVYQLGFFPDIMYRIQF